MCKTPLKGWQIGLTENGKPKYKITSNKVDYLFQRYGYNVWELGYGANNNPNSIEEYIDIPCGKCAECRLNYAREWANRCMLEASMNESNYFLTLTYDDKHLPKKKKINYDEGDDYVYDIYTGEVLYESPYHSLDKRDLQLFMKRLREHFPEQRIRFYACGEYGGQTKRPHYHLILFGLKLDDRDLSYIRRSNKGHRYYISNAISKLWDKGFHIIADCTWETCAYTARYVMKKHKGNDSGIYDYYNYEPEFVTMSRRPGIAYDYYKKYKDIIYENDEIFVETNDGYKKFRPFRYFDRLLSVDDPDFYNVRHDLREEFVKTQKMLKQELSENEYYDILAIENELLEKKLDFIKERSKV